MADPTAPAPEKKRRGCFFYGCVTCIAVFVLFVAFIVFGAWYWVHSINKMIAEYTDTSPVPVPKVEMSADELDRLNARVSEFNRALDARSNTAPLVLTGREIDALLFNNTNNMPVKLNDVLYGTLEGNDVKAQICFPLDRLPNYPFHSFIHTAGRYLNGNAVFDGGLTNSVVSFTVKSMEAKGKPLPVTFTTWVQQFVLGMANNPSNTPSWDRYGTAEVKDGTLIVTAPSH
jgi:hypothetical protein